MLPSQGSWMPLPLQPSWTSPKHRPGRLFPRPSCDATLIWWLPRTWLVSLATSFYSSRDQGQHIFIHQSVGDAHALSVELDTLSPDQRIAEVVLDLAVDFVAYLEHRRPVPHYHRLLVVGLTAPPSHVYPDEIQPPIQLLLQRLDVQVALRRDGDELVRELFHQFVRETSVDQVDLVHDGERRYVDPGAEDSVDKLLVCDVLT